MWAQLVAYLSNTACLHKPMSKLREPLVVLIKTANTRCGCLSDVLSSLLADGVSNHVANAGSKQSETSTKIERAHTLQNIKIRTYSNY